MMMLSVGYPDANAEAKMLEVHLQQTPAITTIGPVITKEDVRTWQAAVPHVYVSPEMRQYLVALLTAVRFDERNLRSVSPRATLLLARASQARAMFAGRNYVTVDDVKAIAPDVLGHRIMTSDSGASRDLVASCIERVVAPA